MLVSESYMMCASSAYQLKIYHYISAMLQPNKRGPKFKAPADKVNKIVAVFFSENQIKRAGGRRAVQEVLNEAAKPLKV